MYKFKDIKTIPPAKQLIDIVLSRTNRKTPTVVHPGYKISRIRSFYMRKVKYCQSTYGEKFAAIVDEFPKIDDIHPFMRICATSSMTVTTTSLRLGKLARVRNSSIT